MSDRYLYIDDQTMSRLLDSLLELMKIMNVDDITTSMLIQHSGVGRTTFYRKFRNKYDFLNQCYQKVLDQTIGRVYRGLSYKEGFYRLYTVLEQYPDFFHNALSSREPDGLFGYMIDQAYDLLSTLLERDGCDMTDQIMQMKVRGYIYSALGLTIEWLRDRSVSMEELLRIFYELMPMKLQVCLAMKYL